MRRNDSSRYNFPSDDIPSSDDDDDRPYFSRRTRREIMQLLRDKAHFDKIDKRFAESRRAQSAPNSDAVSSLLSHGATLLRGKAAEQALDEAIRYYHHNPISAKGGEGGRGNAKRISKSSNAGDEARDLSGIMMAEQPRERHIIPSKVERRQEEEDDDFDGAWTETEPPEQKYELMRLLQKSKIIADIKKDLMNVPQPAERIINQGLTYEDLTSDDDDDDDDLGTESALRKLPPKKRIAATWGSRGHSSGRPSSTKARIDDLFARLNV